MKIYADSPDIAERVIKAHKIKIIDEPKYCPAGKILCEHIRYSSEWDEKICIQLEKRVELLYGCPDISQHKKIIKENKKMSTIIKVAELIAKTPCKTGVANHEVAAADPAHKLSGLQRLRELAKRFKLIILDWHEFAYEYRHNRYYPSAAFKRFCAKFVKERS